MKKGNVAVSMLIMFFSGYAGGMDESLSVAAVQFSIRDEMVSSPDQFKAAIEGALISADPDNNDLIIFPEYTSVFYTLLPFSSELAARETMVDAVSAIILRYPDIASVQDIFQMENWSGELDMFWGGLSSFYDTYIVAGTYFAAVETGDGVELRNRALVYGPDGSRIYQQDKVYLTDFENDLLGLAPGELEDASSFIVKGHAVGITICRDTFFSSWEEHHGTLDLWIDIKANGVPFQEEQEETFLRALPARFAGTSVDYGITVCLTGTFLDMLWEGPSEILKRNTDGTIVTSAKAETADRFRILQVQCYPVNTKSPVISLE